METYRIQVESWLSADRGLPHEFTAYLKRETKKAVLVEYNEEEYWLPKSCINMKLLARSDFSESVELEKIDTKYGTKLALSSEYNSSFVSLIKELDWDSSHRKWDGSRWVIDWDAVPDLIKILNKHTDFQETAKAIGSFFSSHSETEKKEVIIEITNRAILKPLSVIKKYYPSFFKEIRREIGFKHPNERKIRKYSKKDLSNWDGFVFCGTYDWNNGGSLCFDPAFSFKVKEMLGKEGISVEIVDKRPVYTVFTENSLSFNIKELRKPQVDAVKHIVQKLTDFGFCIYQMPPGVGKTITSLKIIHDLRVKTIILVNSRDLMYQWAREIKSVLNYEAGLIGDGKFEPKDITIATLQSLWNYIKTKKAISADDLSLVKKFIETGAINDKKDYAPIPDDTIFNSFSLLILDEAHIGPADTFLAVIRQFQCRYNLAQSATTWRTDRMHPLLWGVFGKPEFVYSINDAIKDGYLVRPEVELVLSPCEFKSWIDENHRLHDPEENYNEAVKQMKNSLERNLKIAEIVKKAPKPCLILTAQTSHQVQLKRVFKQEGIACTFLNGSDSSERRTQVLAQVKAEKIQIVCTTPIWSQGIDIPALRSLVLSFPSKSDVALIQKIGRTLRVFPAKKKCVIYDIVDQNRYFIAHFNERMKVYQEYGWKIVKKSQIKWVSGNLIKCPACGSEFAPPLSRGGLRNYLQNFLSNNDIKNYCHNCRRNKQ